MKKLFLVFLIFSTFIQFFGQNNVDVKIDKRIEAITIFYSLATRDTLDTKPTPSNYYNDFNSYFEKYKNHKSLNWYRNLETWDSYDLSTIGLFLSNQYPFKVEIPYSGHQLRSSDMPTFLSHFNEFYKDCEVEKFLKKHEKQYKKIEKFAKNSIIQSNVLNDVQSFYSKPSKGEILIFADVLNNLGNNAIEINHKPYVDKKIFKLAYLEDENVIQTNETEVQFVPLSNVVVHEISHLYLNDFIPKYVQRLEAKKDLFLTTSKNEILKENKWQNECDELLVRVCVSKILGLKYGKERELQEVQNQSSHFKYFKEFNLFFDKYVKNRSEYKTITDFYPKIVEFMETLK